MAADAKSNFSRKSEHETDFASVSVLFSVLSTPNYFPLYTMANLKIAVIIGSTRPNRFSEKPAKWIFEEAKKLPNADVELIDLRDHPLPFLDQPVSPSMNVSGDYGSAAVNAWSALIASKDAYIIVSPEYNRGTSAVLKNALDSVYKEWNNKAVGFVSYGNAGGARAVEQLRLSAIELQMAPVRTAVHIHGHIAFPIIMGKAEWNAETEAGLKGAADTMLGQLTMWATALKGAREAKK
jgi:NAD(P)H-dependent FMN reductase